MYAQVTKIRVPLGRMTEFRRRLMQDYLPSVRDRNGFLGALFLEQIDDREAGELVLLWESQQAVESFASTGSLMATVHALGAYAAGASIQRQSYLVTAHEGLMLENQVAAANR